MTLWSRNEGHLTPEKVTYNPHLKVTWKNLVPDFVFWDHGSLRFEIEGISPLFILSKTNIAPKNKPSQKESSLPTAQFSGASCYFQGLWGRSFFLLLAPVELWLRQVLSGLHELYRYRCNSRISDRAHHFQCTLALYLSNVHNPCDISLYWSVNGDPGSLEWLIKISIYLGSLIPYIK